MGIVDESIFCHCTLGRGVPVAAHLSLTFSPSFTTIGPEGNRGGEPTVKENIFFKKRLSLTFKMTKRLNKLLKNVSKK